MKKKSLANGNGNNVPSNQCLANELYAIAHFDPSQSDSTPYGPAKLSGKKPIRVFLEKQKICYAGPINIMTLAASDSDYMWQVGTDKVSYLRKSDWKQVASYEALKEATKGKYQTIPKRNFRKFAKLKAKNENIDSMKEHLVECFGENYKDRTSNGLYALVSRDNVLYVKYGSGLFGFKVDDEKNPQNIKVKYDLAEPECTIADGNADAILGLSMTYDGYIIVVFNNGVGIVDQHLTGEVTAFQKFGGCSPSEKEYITNSVAVDKDNGIYVASSTYNGKDSIGYLRKLVWNAPKGTGTGTLSVDWKAKYKTSDEDPPMIKGGNGTGATPTLMGFGDDDDKLVVITDGAKQMNLVAFWRDDIPYGFSNRIAGQIPVTCGLIGEEDTNEEEERWIQTEQSVVVSGYGAFVVNNIPDEWKEEIADESGDLILQSSLIGPVFKGPVGVERFKWNTKDHEWKSEWRNADVTSSSMVPTYCATGNIVIVSGYNETDKMWQLVGLDWNSGEIVHQMNFGKKNYGNGAYSIPQYLEDGSLIFNSIVGPILIPGE